jgi:uncharacterized protein YciI
LDKQELPKEEVDKIMKGHMDNMERLAKEGKLIAAGPFDGGGGIFIFNTTSVDTANSWLSTDPGVQAKRWNLEVLPYKPRVNPPCVAKEPYEMVNYHFIRFTTQSSKSTAKNYSKIIKRHDAHLKKIMKDGNVVTEGTLGNEGGFLILKGELPKELLEADPGVLEAVLQMEIKKLFIAKGSFCEK